MSEALSTDEAPGQLVALGGSRVTARGRAEVWGSSRSAAAAPRVSSSL